MTAHDLLVEAAQRGPTLTPRGDWLAVRPNRLLTPDFAEILRVHKPELLALLDDKKAATAAEIIKPQRPLTEREWVILVRARAENNPIIIEALRLFNARVVE